MQETYILNEKFTFLEYLSITYIQVFKFKSIRWLFIFLGIIGILNGILNSTLSNKQAIVWYKITGQILLPVIFLFLFIIIGSAILTFLLMKLKPKLFSETKLTFTHWGMEKTSEVINYSAPWSKFSKYKETRKFLFLYISDKEYQVIKKEAFENETQLKLFKDFLAEKIYRK